MTDLAKVKQLLILVKSISTSKIRKTTSTSRSRNIKKIKKSFIIGLRLKHYKSKIIKVWRIK